MAIPRKRQVSLQDTHYYHCVSRCVRRAFLCGDDVVTGQSFEHRRGWVVEKLQQLSAVFAIDVCAYAVMSNHTHIVLYVDENKANSWSMQEVLSRWHQLFKGTLLTQKYIRGEALTSYEYEALEAIANVYQKRLIDISWFMRILNEDIARRANQEDNCTGRFWEGRFKSQALLDEAALITCMAYVDLNPVRAGIAPTLEASSFTSIEQRIHCALHDKQPSDLMPFIGNECENSPHGLTFDLCDYLTLVDETGRCIREDKRGFIDNRTPAILKRLNICPENWLALTKGFKHIFHGAVGRTDALTHYCEHQHLKRRQNLTTAERYLA